MSNPGWSEAVTSVTSLTDSLEGYNKSSSTLNSTSRSSRCQIRGLLNVKVTLRSPWGGVSSRGSFLSTGLEIWAQISCVNVEDKHFSCGTWIKKDKRRFVLRDETSGNGLVLAFLCGWSLWLRVCLVKQIIVDAGLPRLLVRCRTQAMSICQLQRIV